MSDTAGEKKAKKKGVKMDLNAFLGGSDAAPSSSDWADEAPDDRDRDRGDRDRDYDRRDRDRDYDRRGGDRDRDYDRRDRDRDRGYDRRDRDRDYDRRGGDRDRDYDRRDRDRDRDYDRRDRRGGDRDYDRRDRRDRYDRDDRREERPRAEIPDEAPFKAYIANLSFDLTQDQIFKFFFEQKPVDVRLIRDHNDPERLKGNGFVEFGTRKDLVAALAMDGDELKGRSIRVSVATPQREEDRKPRGFAGGFEADNMDWRTAKAPEIQPRKDRYGDRRGGRDYDRRDRGDRDYDRRDRGGDRRGGRDDAAERFGFRGERPKLSLKPRSGETPPASPGSAGSSDAPKRKSNPFGAAKPRDENEILKKKEEERAQRDAEKKPKDGKNDGDDDKKDDKPEVKDAKLANKFGALEVADE